MQALCIYSLFLLILTTQEGRYFLLLHMWGKSFQKLSTLLKITHQLSREPRTNWTLNLVLKASVIIIITSNLWSILLSASTCIRRWDGHPPVTPHAKVWRRQELRKEQRVTGVNRATNLPLLHLRWQKSCLWPSVRQGSLFQRPLWKGSVKDSVKANVILFKRLPANIFPSNSKIIRRWNPAPYHHGMGKKALGTRGSPESNS